MLLVFVKIKGGGVDAPKVPPPPRAKGAMLGWAAEKRAPSYFGKYFLRMFAAKPGGRGAAAKSEFT